MSQDDGAERSHEATPQKLEEARKKGELVKSQDVLTWSSYVGAFLCLSLTAPNFGARIADLGGALLQNAETMSMPLRTGGTGRAGEVLLSGMAALGLIAAPVAALVVCAIVVQRAFVVAPSKLAFKLSRISILSNAKNKFGPNGLFEFAKSAVKMTVFSALLGWFFVRHADRFIASAADDPRRLPTLMTGLLSEFVIVVVIVSGAIAAADYFWQRHAHLVKNRMTRQDILDETKKSEGDPMMKGKRRQRAQEIAMNQMLRDVPDAAVVVVNPTHYAVALKWSPLDPSPPICVAKGVDHVAARIREVATASGVPIFSDPTTARALHASIEIGDAIDREHFVAVAAAIRFARELNGADAP